MAKSRSKTPAEKPPAGDGPGPGPAPGPAAAPAAYTVLARRYRSRDFDELVGQEPIAATLRNAIAQNRIAHAYLFTGTRGVGKTSTARVFAKALNAVEGLAEREAIAQAILRGEDIDVIEIDAASNTGVDNVRDLIASAGLVPARSPYKIYIIDEVHMLSRSAFNALLKIMEEPPAHVKFILCTTEPNKVPATIQSRCQRFDFRSIPAARIAEHLRQVLEREGVAYDEQAVMQVARLGNGSMRDALSLLDRLLAGMPGRLDAALVEQLLGLPDNAIVLRLVEAVADGDARGALESGDELLQRGSTPEQAIEAIVDHLRSLMVAVVCGADSELIERAGEARAAVAAQSERFDAPALVHMIALCEATARAARGSAAPRALFDALLVRLAQSERLASIPALLSGGSAEAPAGPRSGEKKNVPAEPVAPRNGSAASPPASHAPTTAWPAAPASAPSAGRTPVVRPAPPSPAAADAASRTPPDATTPSDDRPPDLPAVWSAACGRAQGGIAQGIMADLEPVSFDGRRLEVRYVGETVPTPLHGARVAELVQSVLGRRVQVEVLAPPRRLPQAAVSVTDEVRRHPLVREAMEVFDAAIVAVSDPRGGHAAPPSAQAGERLSDGERR